VHAALVSPSTKAEFRALAHGFNEIIGNGSQNSHEVASACADTHLAYGTCANVAGQYTARRFGRSEARVPVVKGRSPLLLLAALAPLALSACAGHPNVSEFDRCNEQITLSLAPGFGRTDQVIKELSRGADVRLDYLRSASQNLHVYRVSSDGKDPGRVNALARLRQDSRVRFAEPDVRRTTFGAR
jgi:hypothetical protein